MTSSRVPVDDRQAIGQLLVRLLAEFRTDLALPREEAGYGDVRDAHLQIFGNIRMGGVRLTELASRAQLSLSSTSELVNDLENLGYLARRPDPSDRRAKLIVLSDRGRGLMAAAGVRVADIERRWSALVGSEDFDQMCTTMQRLLERLNGDDAHN
jgi:DNA-binding MarR family transcriptional regulator